MKNFLIALSLFSSLSAFSAESIKLSNLGKASLTTNLDLFESETSAEWKSVDILKEEYTNAAKNLTEQLVNYVENELKKSIVGKPTCMGKSNPLNNEVTLVECSVSFL